MNVYAYKSHKQMQGTVTQNKAAGHSKVLPLQDQTILSGIPKSADLGAAGDLPSTEPLPLENRHQPGLGRESEGTILYCQLRPFVPI